MTSLLDPQTWAKACAIASNLAYVHGTLNCKPWSAKKLWSTVITKLDPVGPVHACNGHPSHLRTVYSGVFCGLKLNRDARARAAQIASASIV